MIVVPQKAITWSNVGSSRIECHFLLFRDVEEMPGDQLRGQPAQVEALATAQDRSWNFLRLGRGEEEFHVLRRLLQRLEKGIKGCRGEHVHLVDQVDLIRAASRCVGGILTERADALHAVIARPINLHHIKAASLGDLYTGVAGPARIVRRPVQAIQGLGQDARRRGLADPTGTHKEIGLRKSAPLDRILEGASDVLLTDHLLELLRTVFSGKDAVAHRRKNLPMPLRKVERPSQKITVG